MTVCSRPEGGLRCREGVKPPVNQSINQSNTTESEYHVYFISGNLIPLHIILYQVICPCRAGPRRRGGGLVLINIRLRYIASIGYSERFFFFCYS